MHAAHPTRNLQPGRYAAIDIGTNSVLLLVAEITRDGELLPLLERSRITRLGENVSGTGVLSEGAMSRTLRTVVDYVIAAREAPVECLAVVGTAVLRDAENAERFCTQVRSRCGVMVEVITGEQEAELAWRAQSDDPRLAAPDRHRVVVDIGGGSTEVICGTAQAFSRRSSFRLGAVRITEQHLKHDPPSAPELDAAERAIETALSPVEPAPPAAMLLGTGGTITNLGAVARAAGMITAAATHGARLPHTCVTELVDLFRSMPVRFRQRIPELEPERADVILGGAMILHQAMARLSAVEVIVSTNGIRHGCILTLAERTHALMA